MSAVAEPDAGVATRPEGALVEVEHLTKHFPVKQGVFARAAGVVHAVEDVTLDRQPGRDARHRRRVGLRQVDDRAPDRAPARADLRRRSASTAQDITQPRSQRRMRPLRREMQIIFQDPVLVAEPAQERRRRSSASRSRSTAPRRTRRPRPRAARPRRPEPGALQPLSARVLGRPAPAHRHRPRARAPAEADRLRRAGLGARRLGAGADPQPARRASRASSTSPTSSSRTTSRSIRQVSDRIAVMYVGRVVEIGASELLYEHPRHPYTAALLSAVPRPETNGDGFAGASGSCSRGDVPSPVDPPPACVVPPALPALPARPLRRRDAAAAPVRRATTWPRATTRSSAGRSTGEELRAGRLSA